MKEHEDLTSRRAAFRGLLTETISEWTAPEREIHVSMRDLLVEPPAPPAPPPMPPLRSPLLKGSLAIPPAPLPVKRSLSPGLLALVHSMVADLESKVASLMTLNPSRREAISTHLEKLANLSSTQKTTLADWVNGTRAQSESRALLSFFEEVALITLSQALLLKRWSDRGLRQFQPAHIGKLNWELSSALKPHVPLNRESWHVTRPNLYSWYNPSPSIQFEIWKTFEGLPLVDESPRFLLDLCSEGRRFAPDWAERVGYDPRFYAGLWTNFPKLGVDLSPAPHGRKRCFYTPTLRYGEMTHGSPECVQWLGFESSCFQLLLCEMIELWWGPKAPPTWSQGNSLEAHPSEQLMLSPGNARPTLIQSLIEMEACELAFIVEERAQKASKLKAQLDGLPFFRKLRAAGTSVGTLQACVAVTKLRPGGKMIWVREEPITPDEGSEALGFILGRSKLIAEANLSEIEHSLPTRVPLYPRYVYVFQREVDNEARLSHRPNRIHLQGALKSHIEIPLLIEDAVASLGGSATPTRANWRVHTQISPLPQKEWIAKWPNLACVEAMEAIDTLQADSVPLASLCTIRAVHGPKAKNYGSTGVLIEEDSRKLTIRSLAEIPDGTETTGIVLLASQPAHLMTLKYYLLTSQAQQWLEHHAERKGERWQLTEALMKFIPVPKKLADAIHAKPDSDFEAQVQSLARDPELALAMAHRSPWLRESWKKFVALSTAMAEVERARSRLAGMISPDGRVEWASLIQVFSKNDCIPITQHSLVKMQGSLPVNSPILRIERLKQPSNGILLMNEAGAFLKLYFDNRLIGEIVWDQLKGLSHPTWGEIVHWVRIPRFLEVAETAAQDLLKTYAEIERKRAKLAEFLGKH